MGMDLTNQTLALTLMTLFQHIGPQAAALPLGATAILAWMGLVFGLSKLL
jgi:hypothetical protein